MPKNKFYYVYLITNNILNIKYVGSRISIIDPKNDNYWGSSKYLDEDYKIYGKENFIKEILKYDYNNSMDMLNGETEYILKFNTLYPNGYNRFLPNKRLGFHTGGIKLSERTKQKMSKSKKGHSTTQETRNKISNSKKGHITWMKGKTHTELSKQKIKNNIPDHRGENNPMFGKKHKVESIEKNKISNTGKRHSEESRKKMREAKMNKTKTISL